MPGQIVKDMGECIYCGEEAQLTREHIVPLALNGDLILKNASCPVCSDITKRFEGSVLRGFMLDARTVGKFQTRRPKERPLQLAISRELALGSFERLQLPVDSHPGFLHLPLLEPAGILAGRNSEIGTKLFGFETIRFGSDPGLLLNLLNTRAIRTHHRLYLTQFARLIAKIGYCFASWQHGLLPRTRIPVMDSILGRSDRHSHWIGSADFGTEIEKQRPEHALATCVKTSPIDGYDYLVARVKLFCSTGATGYEVAIGRTADYEMYGYERYPMATITQQSPQ
jgi:hypothetical protein